MTDWSLDRIGQRLRGESLTAHEQVLAQDDQHRATWILWQVRHDTSVVDIGASDGWFSKRLAREGKVVFAIERHPAHIPALADTPPAHWTFFGEARVALMLLPQPPSPSVTLCCEVLEHLDRTAGRKVLDAVTTDRLIVTVPNRQSTSFDGTKRSRWDWPDHKRHFTAKTLRSTLQRASWHVQQVEPIVGTLSDSIWLGAVCRRG